jgi:hypothetical protein
MSGAVPFNGLWSTYRVTSIAVGGAIGRVNPTPIVINDHGARLLSAATGSALVPGKTWVSLLSLRANLLGTCSRHQGREKEGTLIHASQRKE